MRKLNVHSGIENNKIISLSIFIYFIKKWHKYLIKLLKFYRVKHNAWCILYSDQLHQQTDPTSCQKLIVARRLNSELMLFLIKTKYRK